MQDSLTLVDYSTFFEKGIEPVRVSSHGQCSCVQSPYFVSPEAQKIGHGQGYSFISELMKAIAGLDYAVGIGGLQHVGVGFFDGSPEACVDAQNLVVDMANANSAADIITSATASINAYATAQGYTLTSIFWTYALPVATPSSYQTIISQTGTAAPATTGTFTPTNTYASSPTFTWARTSAGVYTLTASSAVFDTTGKTGVFVGGLNNLNGSYKYVVTSSTVITFTFAVQSLAVLGLLGFTSTPTDALLTQTMVYVQTYS